MSRGIVTRENLEDIADAIRAKLDTDDTYTPAQMAAAIGLIHGEPVLQSKTATQNGTVTPDSGYDGLDQVTVDVPNTYGTSDEGKVVSNAALVAQTARTVTENGTFDTTLNNSVTVAVPRPAGTLAKKGASSTVSSIPALYGPMGTLSSDYLTPVGFATGANVTLNTAQPYEVKAVFKLTQLPVAQAAIFGHADSASPVPAMYVAAGGGNIRYAIPEPPEVQGESVIYREGNVYSTDTPLPLNTEITVSIRCNGTSFVVTVDNGTAVTSKSDTDYTPYAGTGGLLLGMDERRENGLAGVSGAYINAEDSAIIQNGTRLWGGVIEGGGGGSEPVIQPLTATENGTYTPPTGVDGYGPVTVNVSGGGSSNIEEWDFTQSLTGKIRGFISILHGSATQDSRGIVFGDDITTSIEIPIRLPNMTIEIDVATMNLSSGSHRRFVMTTDSEGFIYRNNGKWSFYARSSWATDSDITDGSFFANSTVKIVIDENSYWHIYKNNVLVYEPNRSLSFGLIKFYLGSISNSINGVIITGMRVY